MTLEERGGFQNLTFYYTCSCEIAVAVRSKAWFAAARLLGLGVLIPPRTRMYVCCECCVLSGRRSCVGLITYPAESYRVLCVWGWGNGMFIRVCYTTKPHISEDGYIVMLHYPKLLILYRNYRKSSEAYCGQWNQEVAAQRDIQCIFQLLHEPVDKER
jgi:hypothetical protein